MRKSNVYFGLLIFAVFISGCAHREKIRAVEGDIDTPYESLGTLEVHLSTNPWNPPNWVWSSKELMTFSLWDTSYQKRLQDELVKKAKKYQGVDQLINTQYWPEPGSKYFPHASRPMKDHQPEENPARSIAE